MKILNRITRRQKSRVIVKREESFWKKEKIKRWKKRFRLVIFGYLSILMLAGVVVFWGFLFREYRMRTWDGVNRAGILFIDPEGKFELFSINPVDKKMVFILFEKNVVIPLLNGYGEYQVRAIPGLVKLDKDRNVVYQSLEHWLVTPVLAQVWIDDLEDKGNLDLAKALLTTKTEGNVSLWDKLSLAIGMVNVWGGSQEKIDLGKKFGNPAQDIDGYEKVLIDKEKLADIVASYLENPVISKRLDTNLTVLNGTGVLGLATITADNLELAGYDVVGVAETEELAKTKIIVSNEVINPHEYLFLLERLVGTKAEIVFGVKDQYRAQVAVLLGKDYAEKVYGKSWLF